MMPYLIITKNAGHKFNLTLHIPLEISLILFALVNLFKIKLLFLSPIYSDIPLNSFAI